jgi:acyl-CoA reductase-like NAD-dependent aldehyde dehydrogenase
MQEQVDTIFQAAALAANQARIPLAKMAVEETRMGVVEDKVRRMPGASSVHRWLLQSNALMLPDSFNLQHNAVSPCLLRCTLPVPGP